MASRIPWLPSSVGTKKAMRTGLARVKSLDLWIRFHGTHSLGFNRDIVRKRSSWGHHEISDWPSEMNVTGIAIGEIHPRRSDRMSIMIRRRYFSARQNPSAIKGAGHCTSRIVQNTGPSKT
jgi:hypothetical protein